MAHLPTQIPGMIEPVEQDMLTDLAEFIDLAEGDVICEFGSYFGRSARCLADGLAKNRQLDFTQRKFAVLHAYDVFACSTTGALAPYVLRDAERAQLAGLLQFEGERIDFSRIFDHHMDGLAPGLLQRHQIKLAAARHCGGAIALMHIDAPKWFAEYRQLLREFGPHLKQGAQLVFQDYFYHWSAELIATVQLFIDSGLFEPQESAASSLLVRVSGPVDADMLAWLDTQYAAADIGELVKRAIRQFANFEVDRPEVFVSRLYLAGMQHSFESANYERSGRWLLGLQHSVRGTIQPQVMADLADLVSHGFSIRGLYEQDTAAR